MGCGAWEERGENISIRRADRIHLLVSLKARRGKTGRRFHGARRCCLASAARQLYIGPSPSVLHLADGADVTVTPWRVYYLSVHSISRTGRLENSQVQSKNNDTGNKRGGGQKTNGRRKKEESIKQLERKRCKTRLQIGRADCVCGGGGGKEGEPSLNGKSTFTASTKPSKPRWFSS